MIEIILLSGLVILWIFGFYFSRRYLKKEIQYYIRNLELEVEKLRNKIKEKDILSSYTEDKLKQLSSENLKFILETESDCFVSIWKTLPNDTKGLLIKRFPKEDREKAQKIIDDLNKYYEF